MGQYIENANKQIQVIVQIEHIDAVQNLEEILAVEGINGIFIGPTDLSQSMGMTGQFNNPALRDVISRVIARTKASDKWIGIFCVNAADAKSWADKGAVLLTIATDTMLIAQAARELKRQVNI
jgi:4-hydroxy-2-oxoheptanedioate aldolase